MRTVAMRATYGSHAGWGFQKRAAMDDLERNAGRSVPLNEVTFDPIVVDPEPDLILITEVSNRAPVVFNS